METFIYKIKQHWIAVVISVILGLLMVLPFLYFQIKLGENFKGILPEIVNDENFYYARIKDIIDGHPFLGNAYLYEHKNELPQQVFLAEWLLARPLKLFGISIGAGHLIYNFLFPAIAFLLAYTAFYLILRRKFWSLIFSLFLFFGLFPLAFIRPISPQFNFIFWLTQFIFFWLFITERRRKWVWLSAVNFGLLFYIYPYYWTFYLIFFLIFIAFDLLNFKRFHRSLPTGDLPKGDNYGSKEIIKIIVGGLVLAIPYFCINYLSSRLPHYTETLTRLGMIYTRFPSGFRIIFWSALGLAAFSCFLWRKIIAWDIKTIFFVLGILASIIAVNQHLITGKNFEFSSHYDMGAIFFLVFALAYLVSRCNTNTRTHTNVINIVLGFLISVFIVWGILDYSQRVFGIDENVIYQQNYAAIFDWLNKNTAKDSVVYANADLSGLIPVYTADNVYYVREANLFFISDKEVLDRFILNNFFGKFDRDFVVENVRSIYGVRYIDAYGHAVQGNKLRKILGLRLEPEIYLPEEVIEKVMVRADELQKEDFLKELKKSNIDYLIWDKTKNPSWRIDEQKFKKVFSAGDTIIFQMF